MALVGFMFGSLIGTLAGLVGWLGFDLGLLQAFALYMACGLGLGLLTVLAAAMRPDEGGDLSAAELGGAA